MKEMNKMRIFIVMVSLIFILGLSEQNSSAHEMEHRFEKFANGKHCQELESEEKKIKLCIASIRFSNKFALAYGHQFYCAGKLKISEEGIVQSVSVKKIRGDRSLLRSCLTSMRKFKFYPPIDENGKNVNLQKVIMSMNYVEKKYAMPTIKFYNVHVNFGEVIKYKSKPFTGFSMLTFAAYSPKVAR